LGTFWKSGNPKYGNLVPRDVATRAIFKVVYEHGLGIDGNPMVYLDLTHIDRKILDRKLEGILENLREIRGRRSTRRAHENLPRHALHHGRPVGGLQASNQRSRHICGGRGPNINITALTGWARIHWCLVSTAVSSPAQRPCNMHAG